MVFINSPELVGTYLVNALREEFPTISNLFGGIACTRTTLRVLIGLLRFRGVKDCHQGVTIATGVDKASFGPNTPVDTETD
jgi:hypothetical protein